MKTEPMPLCPRFRSLSDWEDFIAGKADRRIPPYKIDGNLSVKNQEYENAPYEVSYIMGPKTKLK